MGEKRRNHLESPPKPALEKGKFRDNTNGGSDRPKKLACYFYGDPHKAIDCLKRVNLAALIQREEEKQQEETRLHSLRLLNAIKAKVNEEPRGPMFVEITISGKTFKALLDTGASYLLVSSDVASIAGP